MIYIAVLCNSRITAEPLYNTPLVHWTLCRCQQYGAFSMKALARYQVILLGEQRHIRCEQLAQGCCPNNATVGVEPATCRSQDQRPTAALPSHYVALISVLSAGHQLKLQDAGLVHYIALQGVSIHPLFLLAC